MAQHAADVGTEIPGGRAAPARAIVVLAVLQAVAGVVWGAQWIVAGVQTMGHGVLFIPMVGVALLVRGTSALVMALLYALFARAALAGRPSAWPLGVGAAALNLLGVLVLAVAGESMTTLLLRGAVAVVILVYLVARGRRSGRASSSRSTSHGGRR